MELPTKVSGSHKVRNLPVVQSMKTRCRGIPTRIDRAIGVTGALAALLFCGYPSTGYAQQTSTDQVQPHKKTVPDAPAPPAEARPSGDPQSGVLKPPNVDPKMAKPVPDVDPAMDNPPPGKTPGPTDPTVPKVQPK
jgi:hypothetical protein